jgi:hypothetical protein
MDAPKPSIENFPLALAKFPKASSKRFPKTARYRSVGPDSGGHGMCLHRRSVLSEATMASGHLPVSEWLQRIRAEYREMPGLSLNKEQMQKMWGLDAFVCDALVDALVAARVLRRTMGGAYVVYGTGL